MGDVHNLSKLQRSNALKTLFKMRLHTGRVLRLRQDLKQLIVGEEEETREEQPLLLQVLIQSLNVNHILKYFCDFLTRIVLKEGTVFTE